ncbi:MAG TPA: lysylphosphatidylglycerol synthase transmembrane domain-containing protein [Candidatus Dormibacteraeota bacterium]|nr:lysylphosphatidylglycerol synthase transmembrane domain-containing protein [Candidatus Dormibacteraeota bacterium]
MPLPPHLPRAARVLRDVAGSLWFRLLGSAVAVFLFLHGVDIGAAIHLFSHLDPGWALLAIALAALSVASSVLEWGVFLRGTGHGLDWSFLGTWYLKGLFVNQVLPAGIGSDAMRALQMGRITGHGAMVASLVASRMAGTLGMALWGLCAAVLMRSLLGIPEFAGFVVFAAAMMVAWVLALIAERYRARIPEHWRMWHAFGRALHPFTSAFDAYRCRPSIITQSIVAGTVGWGLNLFSMQAFSLALGANVSWEVFAVALPIALLATFIPISANGIGVREGLLVVLLVQSHVSIPMATALALFVDLQLVPFAILGGLVYLVEHGWMHRPLWLIRRLGERVGGALSPVSSQPAPERVVDGRERNR